MLRNTLQEHFRAPGFIIWNIPMKNSFMLALDLLYIYIHIHTHTHCDSLPVRSWKNQVSSWNICKNEKPRQLLLVHISKLLSRERVPVHTASRRVRACTPPTPHQHRVKPLKSLCPSTGRKVVHCGYFTLRMFHY